MEKHSKNASKEMQSHTLCLVQQPALQGPEQLHSHARQQSPQQQLQEYQDCGQDQLLLATK